MSNTDEASRRTDGLTPADESAAAEPVGAQDAAPAEEAAEVVAHPDEKVFRVIAAPDDAFDYVVPSETYQQHNRRKRHEHRHHHRHHHHSSAVAEEEKALEADGYVFPEKKKRKKRHRKWKHMAWWKKTLIIVASVLLVLVISLGSAFFIMREIGRGHMHDYNDIEIVPPTEHDDVINVDRQGRIIHYNGESYILNENLVSITFIGADNGAEETGDRRMSDAIYIMTVDTVTGKVRVLGVSRDTICDVNRYSVEGKFIDTTRQQIAYSYSYYSDKVTGGMNTNASISKLFFGLPAKNYFAINLDALNDLNNAIGGVTLTSTMTFESPEDGRTISEGETVTLHGKEAERYIRTRDTSKLDSNNERMERQQQYIRAFLNSIVPAVKEDISRIGALYDVVKANSDANLGLSDLTYLASTVLPKIRSAGEIEYVTLKGEMSEGSHPEMHVSDDEALRTMLDVFYLPYT